MNRLCCVGLVMLGLVLCDGSVVHAGPQEARTAATARGDAERGRAVFNGKGVCYYCHGVDGYRHKLPQLEGDTSALIAQLNPQPTDLRNPKVLRLDTDKQRVRAIREGHPGTGMFPDTRMKDAEVADVLAYLAVLRSGGTSMNAPQSPR